MPLLKRLREAGFVGVALRPGRGLPMVVEMYTRLNTGAGAQVEYGARAETPTTGSAERPRGYAALSRGVIARAGE